VPRWKNTLQTSDEVFRLKRNAVLREATRIFAKRGFHDTSLDDIAAALQVAKGTLYNYVKDKQEILFECHRMALDIGDQALALADTVDGTAYAKIRLVLRAYLMWLSGALGGGGIVTDVTALRPSDRKAVIVRRDRFQSRLIGYLEEGFADRTIRRVDPRLAVYTIMGAINAVQAWYDPKGRLSMDQVASQMVDLLMRGLDTDADAGSVDVPIPLYGATAEPAAEKTGVPRRAATPATAKRSRSRSAAL
jgi:AcrR family transcriptional regulator